MENTFACLAIAQQIQDIYFANDATKIANIVLCSSPLKTENLHTEYKIIQI